MLKTPLILLTLLAYHALSAPTVTEKRTSLPSWTLQAFTRSCNDGTNSCQYSFAVIKNDGNPAAACLYNIFGSPQHSARVTDYQLQSCTPGSNLTLNQGWDSNTQSMTLVVTDTPTQYYAFFGYTAAQMTDGQAVTPDETRRAMPVGTFRKREIYNVGWTVKDFSRVCDVYSHACTYNFSISSGGYAPDFACQVLDKSPDYTPLGHDSWYSFPCNGNEGSSGEWVISWGYNPAYDSAVMTVLNVPLQEDAWFGWNNVNSVTNLADIGPNKVYKLGTST